MSINNLQPHYRDFSDSGIESFGPRSSIGGRCLWWLVTDWYAIAKAKAWTYTKQTKWTSAWKKSHDSITKQRWYIYPRPANIAHTSFTNCYYAKKRIITKEPLTTWSWSGGAYMPVVIVVLLRVSFDGASDIFLNPVGTTTIGIPTRLPTQTFSQSVAFPINASTLKLSLTCWINIPLALCAWWSIIHVLILVLANSEPTV